MDIKSLLEIDIHTQAGAWSRNPGDPLWQAMQKASARYPLLLFALLPQNISQSIGLTTIPGCRPHLLSYDR